MKLNRILILLLVTNPNAGPAQEKNMIKFGDVKPHDLMIKQYQIDSGAGAVIIADVGSSSIESNYEGRFFVKTKHFKRMHILSKKAYDIANVVIPVFSFYGVGESLDNLKASTYNLQDGKLEESRLDTKGSVFEDKITRDIKIKKFTFPNVKEGSIIEYEYSTTSDFIADIHTWYFQGAYPVLWSEFHFIVPSFFRYSFITQGYLSFNIETKNESTTLFTTGGYRSQNSLVTDYCWVVENVPVLKEEKFITTINNYIQKIDFQLVEQGEKLVYHRYVKSWPEMTKELLAHDKFGSQLDKDNKWMNTVTDPLKEGVENKTKLAEKVFNYVRDNFTCTSHNDLFMTSSFKDLVRTHQGNVADINLLLVGLLRHVNISADPIILGTRQHGSMYAIYPILNQYNYVICQAIIDNHIYFLDASEPHMGFGWLPLHCYNGDARLVNEGAPAVTLNPDFLPETKTTTVFFINDEKGNIVGSMQQTPGYYESVDIRNRIREKGMEQFISEIKKDFGYQIEISNFGIDSLSQYDFPVNIHYDFDMKDTKEDIIYFTPLLGQVIKENPFKSSERKYPVEMPYIQDETYNLEMDIPVGYEVDEQPSSVIIKLNEEGDGTFEYQVSHSVKNISLRSRIRINKTFYLPEDYENLRIFFDLVVKKQAEQIVFKKKK